MTRRGTLLTAMTPGSRSRLTFVALVAAYFAVLVVALIGPALLWRPRAVVSAADQDIDRQFYPWREFAFSEWRATGRPPTWNPYAFGGVPALGNVQYALYYPPNWIHFLLPTGWAINVIAAFHVWLSGVLTAAWCRGHGKSVVACLIGGTIFALCGPVLLHLYAGHLTYLCVVAWTPAVFLSCDRIAERAAPRWTALGAGIVAMQLLGGYPQPAFYTAILAVPYVVLRAWWSADDESPSRAVVRTLAMVAGMYVLGASLAAAQMLPALDAAREGVRATPLTFGQASTYALPTENLLTLIVPYPLGDDFSAPYRGKWLFWETSVFVGGVAWMMAMWGVAGWRRRPSHERAAGAVLILALLFALGGAAFAALYHIVPGVDRFRAPGRFAFLAALMIAALAASGFDMLRQADVRRGGTYLSAAIAALVTASLWPRHRAGALVFAQLTVFFLLIARRPQIAYVLPLLLLLEMWRPAVRTIEWFPPRPTPSMLPPRWPDQRVLTTSPKRLNQATAWRVEDAWGYDPATAARWADLVGPLLGADARRGDFTPTREISDTRDSPIWRMIRVDNGDVPPLPRALLIDDVRRVATAAKSLAAMRSPDFDPARTVVVEASEDEIRSYGITRGEGPIGDVTVVRRTADSLEIVADVSRGAILLVTDAYSAGWRVRAAEPGPEPIEVLPANHALRAVPLAAGKHHFVMEYRPRSIVVGRWVSGVAIVAVIATLALHRRGR